jgi:hypothetical protein
MMSDKRDGVGSVPIEHDEVQALNEQGRKLLRLLALATDEDRAKIALETETFKAMLLQMTAHRGEPHLTMTKEQALELATVLHEFGAIATAAGVPEPSFEDLMPMAEQLMNMPKPHKN